MQFQYLRSGTLILGLGFDLGLKAKFLGLGLGLKVKFLGLGL